MQKDKIKILIIGNGFGGTYTLKNLTKYFHKSKNVELALIGEKNYFLFTPLLHEVATGSINPENIIEPIRKVFDTSLANFYLGKVQEVDLHNNIVRACNTSIHYDYLVMASGSETNFYNIKGAQDYTLTLKSLEDAIKIKNHIINRIEEASHVEDKIERKKILTFVIVGGGPTGVELAAELQELIKKSFVKYYKKEIIDETSVILIQKNGELLSQFGLKIRKKALEFLQNKGIKILLNTEVKEVEIASVITNNEKIDSKTIIWVGGIKAKQIKVINEVEKTKDGRIVVNQNLQIEKYKNVFALGDAAAFTNNSGVFLPALAQVAEKQAKIVAENIYLSIQNKKLKSFKYKHNGSLVSLGQWMALGEISNFTFWGHITWWLWRTIYLSKLISFRKKVKVALDWTVNIFSPRDISEF